MSFKDAFRGQSYQYARKEPQKIYNGYAMTYEEAVSLSAKHYFKAHNIITHDHIREAERAMYQCLDQGQVVDKAVCHPDRHRARYLVEGVEAFSVFFCLRAIASDTAPLSVQGSHVLTHATAQAYGVSVLDAKHSKCVQIIHHEHLKLVVIEAVMVTYPSGPKRWDEIKETMFDRIQPSMGGDLRVQFYNPNRSAMSYAIIGFRRHKELK
jgi:hypothetical protein